MFMFRACGGEFATLPIWRCADATPCDNLFHNGLNRSGLRDLPFAQRAQLASCQRNNCQRLAFEADEFDFVSQVAVAKHHGADIATFQATLGHVFGQHNGLEFLEHRGTRLSHGMLAEEQCDDGFV